MMNERKTEQPGVCRGCKDSELTKYNRDGLCPPCRRKMRIVAAADSNLRASVAERTAFACSALLALAAGWEEELMMRREMAAEEAAKRNYTKAAEYERDGDMLFRALHSVRDEMWRAGLAAEANGALYGEQGGQSE